jgi:rhodanese-related sulfurtransferase
VNQFFQFVINHWILWSVLVILLLLLLVEEIRGRVAGVSKVSPQELTRMINQEEAVVIDVRDANAFSTGHIIDSVNIPHTLFDTSMEKIAKYKDKPIIVVCSNGQTSPLEAAKLLKKDYEKVYFLGGGLTAWQQAGLPLSKGQ